MRIPLFVMISVREGTERSAHNYQMIENEEPGGGLNLQNGLEKDGYSHHFTFRDGRVFDPASNRQFSAVDLRIDDFFRFEGPSDPDNLSVVYALSSSSGEKGLLIDAFGTYGDPALAEFMRHVSGK